MSWNNKQETVREFNARNHPEMLICDGAVGSGKTTISIAAWVTDIWTHRNEKRNYICLGYTLGSLKRNILNPLYDLVGISTDLDDENSFGLWGNRIICFGTDKADSHKTIRGIMTAHGFYANEISLSNRTAIDEAFHRCRGKGSRFFIETNPANPEHWFHNNHILPAVRDGNNRKLARFNFSLYDNDQAHGGFLDADYIDRQEKLHSGIWHRQMILGEWCALEGQIYHLERLQFYEEEVRETLNWFIGTIIHGYLDPAAGSQKKAGCYTSIITGCMKDGKIYILDAVVRKYGVRDTIRTVGDLLGRFNYQRLVYEDNFTQEEYVGRPLREAYPFAPIQGQSSREDKLSRLIAMQNVVETKVYFPDRFRTERGSDGWLLLQQLCNITKERDEKASSEEMFLDAPDALEGLIRTFRNYGSGRRDTLAVGGDDIRKKTEW